MQLSVRRDTLFCKYLERSAGWANLRADRYPFVQRANMGRHRRLGLYGTVVKNR